jgi:hypothetical protein
MAGVGGAVRSGFGYYHTFDAGWFGAHPLAWRPGTWAAGGLWGTGAWAAAPWATLSSWIGILDGPVYYDYGTNVLYQNNTVFVNGEESCTAPEYAAQASALATQGIQAAPPATDQWQSLGVFALVQAGELSSNDIFQLAVNQSGIIRGNYYDGLLDVTTPVKGAVDKTTQRAAWTIGDKTDRVFDCSIFNLTKNESPVLIHLGGDRTQQWLLVRMKQPVGQQ